MSAKIIQFPSQNDEKPAEGTQKKELCLVSGGLVPYEVAMQIYQLAPHLFADIIVEVEA